MAAMIFKGHLNMWIWLIFHLRKSALEEMSGLTSGAHWTKTQKADFTLWNIGYQTSATQENGVETLRECVLWK